MFSSFFLLRFALEELAHAVEVRFLWQLTFFCVRQWLLRRKAQVVRVRPIAATAPLLLGWCCGTSQSLPGGPVAADDLLSWTGTPAFPTVQAAHHRELSASNWVPNRGRPVCIRDQIG